MIAKKYIQCLRTDVIGSINFWKEIESLFEKGWKVVLEGNRREAPRWFSHPFVTFSKNVAEGEDVRSELRVGVKVIDVLENQVQASKPIQIEIKEKIELTDLEQLEKLAGKVELLEFAVGKNILVPEEIKWPAAIKKAIREALEIKKEEKHQEDISEPEEIRHEE